jgi:uncharacterized protein (DUF488 family)
MARPDAEVPPQFCTVGHGDRDPEAFRQMLTAAGVELLVDIRTLPSSRRHPQFDEAALHAACAEDGITYHWAGRALGGLRRAAPDSPHGALPEALRGFADHADGPGFGRALEQLEGLARSGRVALLCAERDPLQCHRSLVADCLLLRGHDVVHLVDPGHSLVHQLRPEARRAGERLVYDRGATPPLAL